MMRQPTDLADARVETLIAACESGMKALLQTERAEVFFYAANGHGGWEAVIANLVAAGHLDPDARHRPLLRRLGRAGGGVRRRGAAHALCRRDADRPGRRRGGAARRRRPSHRRGLRGPHRHRHRRHLRPAALRRAIDAARHPALFVVDVVASLAAAPFAMDALGVDVAIGASQKGLMVPPGLAFVAATSGRDGAGARQPGAALLLGLGAAAQRAWRIGSSAARTDRPFAGLEAASADHREGLAAVYARHRATRPTRSMRPRSVLGRRRRAARLLPRPEARSVS